ncbi:hypothetical protein QFW77_16410 [Luteimonas sp. RD2P54]|uniref:Uncharacterized protein n=1 Tax=Luteimonas endophytica TaxID=3042023 RepID=A0ABT6JEC7_9GAMM|nr:hypothetical protein [Luteimonas endophytica]MDH5824558.1 hypothetical protein [Luteimonas endophytica]
MRLLALVIALSLLFPGSVDGSDAEPDFDHPAPVQWSATYAESGIDSVRIELVRGSVTVVRREGPLVIEARKRRYGGRATDVDVLATEREGHLRLVDTYPTESAAVAMECHPPIDERGEYWSSDMGLDLVVRASAAVEVSHFIMSD